MVSMSKDANVIADFDILHEMPYTFEFYEVQMLRRKVPRHGRWSHYTPSVPPYSRHKVY